MTYIELGTLIKQHREKLGWDQAALAKMMQVKQQSVSRWEKGLSRPERDVIVTLSGVLQTGIHEMLSVAGYELPKPVRPLLAVLPLGDLTAESFELFCRAFIAALNPGADVSRYGSQGDTQEGIDLYSKNGKHIRDYQCKRHLQFGPKNVAQAVAYTTFEAEHHHLLLSRKATPNARKAINTYEQWSLWDNEDICAKIQQELPKDKALRIVDTFFPGWRKDFLGEPDPSPWLTSEEFFRPLASRIKLFNHDWSFVGRHSELTSLDAFARSELKQIIIVSGRGGVGKSRLLRAFSERVPVTTQVLFASATTEIKPRDLELLPANGILVIDDAHESPDLSQLLNDIALLRPQLKLLISMRPYVLSQVQYDLARSGYVVDAEDSLVLSDLTLGEARSLAEEIMTESQGGSEYSQRIAEITKDCPLATVIGSRLVATGRIRPELLNNSEEFRRLILETFREIVTGEIGGPKGAEDIQDVLSFVAMIQPINPADPLFKVAASTFLNKRYDQILTCLRDLENAGVLLRRKNSLRIVPDLLADYIRSEITYDSKNSIPTGYADEVFKLVQNELAINLLVNLSQLDWRISATGVQTALLNSIWANIERQFKNAKIFTRQAILKDMEKVAFYQPTHALSLARLAIEQPTTEVEPEFGGSLIYSSYDNVLTKIPPILQYVGYNSEYLPDVLDLLRVLAQQDKRQPNQYPAHSMRVLCELAGIEPNKPLEFNEIVVEHVIGWLKEPATPNFSPFDVLDAMLATEGHQTQFNDSTLTLIPYKVKADAVDKIRNNILDEAFKVVCTKSLPEASRALKTIQESLLSPGGPHVTEEDRFQWQPGQLRVFTQLEAIASDTRLDPYLFVEIRRAVVWHVSFSPDPIQSAARAVLDAIPTHIDYEFSHALADDWGDTFEISKDFQQNEAAFILWRKQLSLEMIEKYKSNFDALIVLLEERITTLHEIKLMPYANGGAFVTSLVLESPRFGKILASYILQHTQSPLAKHLALVLNALIDSDYDAVLDLAEGAIKIGNIDLLHRVSWSLSLGARGKIVSPREIEIIKTLMSSVDVRVRKNIVRAVGRFTTRDKVSAIDMLLHMNFADSMELANEVLSQFHEYGPFTINDLDKLQIEGILTQIIMVNSIDAHDICMFVGHLSVAEPELSLKFLMDRVEYKENNLLLPDYLPLPHTFMHGKYLQFYKAAAYEDLLRIVRDWANEETNGWIRSHCGPDLFRMVSSGYDEATLRVLNEWIMSPEQKYIEMAALLLSKVDRGFLWSNSEYVIHMLNRAQQHGKSCFERVSSNFYVIALQGSRSRILKQPFPEDTEQRDRSQELMERQPIGSPAYQFYKSLYDTALSNIKRDTVDEED